MSGRVNIPRSIKDNHYRYTMASLEIKIEGSGNGIYCKIPNLKDIGTDLKREPIDILKFFGFELASHIRCPDADTFIINGKFHKEKLANTLDIFIDKFVLCKKCKNPETNLLTKGGNIYLHCISCGHEGMGDMKHKFADYITKEVKKRSSNSEDKQKKKSSKKSSSKKEKEEEEDDPSLFQNSTKEEDVKKRRKMLLGESGPSKEKGVSWWKSEFKKLLENSDDKISREKLIEFRNKILWTPDDLTKFMVETCINENLLKQVVPFGKRFSEFFGEKRTQRSLINSIMEVIGNRYPQFVERIAQVIKGLYDLDCLEEDVILEWYDTTDPGSEKNIEKITELKLGMVTLVNWLKNSEEEE
eukprot:TRINITY_DN147_c0_g1_i1.p1 TRINITY_DN147_c0_g1~~TRINITY_DN147_c0_g1_i1.p1  ORF type:complete len:358 (+),score=119.83 TRINITY_DN147_c0_g1_i1:30-1103(+)